MTEIIAMPIFSEEAGGVIGALVLGFPPFEFGGREPRSGVKSGIWLHDRLHSAELPAAAEPVLRDAVSRGTERPVERERVRRAALLPVWSDHRDGPHLTADIREQGDAGCEDAVVIGDQNIHGGES